MERYGKSRTFPENAPKIKRQFTTKEKTGSYRYTSAQPITNFVFLHYLEENYRQR